MMKLLIFIPLYLFLICCQEKIQTRVIQAPFTTKVYPDTTWFSECEIIFPETTEGSLISMIRKMIVTPELIFIQDIQYNKLVLFSRQGKFITGIYPTGRGPGEWLNMTDFTINEATKEIMITADRPYKFLYYDFNGKFLREKTGEAFYHGIAQTDQYILAINSKALYPDHYLSLLKEKGHQISVEKKIPLKFAYLGDFQCRGSYLTKSEHLYFTQNGDYTIYKWENNQIQPLFSVDFGKYNCNPVLMKTEPNSAQNQQKVLSIINVKEINNRLFFNTNKTGLFVYNKEKDEITYTKGLLNTRLGINLYNHIGTEDTNNKIIAFYYETQALQYRLSKTISDDPIIKVIKEAKEDENPVLFLYKSI